MSLLKFSEKVATISIEIRQMASHEDYLACVRLQKQTWGENFNEIAPPSILMIARKIGGLAAGAYNASNEMVGFVFSMPGSINGESIHWSHMLAVKPLYRGRGCGFSLKSFQRKFCLENDIRCVYWTYDPLVARNAHMNLNKLGASIEQYVQNFYPENSGSVLHQGMSLDRFTVKWDLSRARVEHAVSGYVNKIPVDTEDFPIADFQEAQLANANGVRVEIPLNIEDLLLQSPQEAVNWRMNTRRIFSSYLQKDFIVTNFYTESGRAFYILQKF